MSRIGTDAPAPSAASRPAPRGLRRALAGAALGLGLVACASSTSPAPQARATAPATPEATPSPQSTPSPEPTPSPTTTPVASGSCHAGDPLAGVYHPARLHLVTACVTVTGRVGCLRAEPDGDHHILVSLDARYTHLLTAGNTEARCRGQSGPHLVVETLPQHCGAQTQADAADNCADNGGFTTPDTPASGARVKVTGPLVIDTAPGHGEEGHGWAEIHPAEKIGTG